MSLVEERYSRQTRLPGIGKEGAEKIANAHVMIVGVGALGTHLSELFCRAGVRKLTLIDRDWVEYSNLQRQTLFTELDAQNAAPKVFATQAQLAKINSNVEVDVHMTEFNVTFVNQHTSLFDCVDLILDGVDNFETRFLINDIAVKYSLPYIYGSAVGMEACCFAILPHHTPCLSCIMATNNSPSLQATCSINGVLASSITYVTSVQFSEAIKIITGNISACNSQMLFCNLWENLHFQIPTKKLADCPTCGKLTFPYLSIDKQRKSRTICGKNAIQLYLENINSQFLEQQAKRASGNIKRKSPFHIEMEFYVDGIAHSLILFHDGRVTIDGTIDEQRARHILAETIGY